MKKVLVVVVVCVAALGAGSWIYLGSDAYAYTSTHFPRHTWINHVDCSGLTCHQAKQKLTEVWNRKTYKIERNGTVIGTIGAFDYSYEIDQQLQNLMGTGIFKALRNQFSDKHQYRTVKMTPKTTKSFDRQIRSMSFLYRPYTVKTKNAYVDLNHKAMNIVKEVRGNNIDPDRFTRKIKHDIAKGRFSMEYTPSDYYALPSVTSSDTLLKKEQAFDRDHYSQTITYHLYHGTYTITPKNLKKMMPVKGKDHTEIDQKAVRRFVNKTLAWEINTAYAPRKFKSHTGKVIRVEGGNYGYAINKKKEYQHLLRELKSGKAVSRKPYYAQQPYYKGGGMNDIGNSYVEIDLANQELYLYLKGKRSMSTSIVSGQYGKHDTPTGVYQIEFKQLNATLRGNNDDGSAYNSKVTYWMPFNGGVGCHDASWRGAFGGNIYLSDGSHGCVNMPTYEAAYLYSKVEKGFPVVVHY